MSTYNMADLYNEAEKEGMDLSPDLPNGIHTVRVKSSGVTKGAKSDRLYLVLEALDGSGTIVHGNNFMPDNKNSLFYWFRFLGDFGIGKDFLAANPGVTLEALGSAIESRGAMYRVEVAPQKKNPQYTEVKVLGEVDSAPTPAVDPAPAGDSEPAPWEQ